MYFDETWHICLVVLSCSVTPSAVLDHRIGIAKAMETKIYKSFLSPREVKLRSFSPITMGFSQAEGKQPISELWVWSTAVARETKLPF